LLFFTKHIFRDLVLFFLLLVSASSCHSVLSVSSLDISNLYDATNKKSIKLEHLYNITDSLTSIGLLVPAGLIAPDPKTKTYKLKGTLRYEIFSNRKSSVITDTATFAIADTISNLEFIPHSWEFKAPSGFDYFVKASYSVPEKKDDFLFLQYFTKKQKTSASWVQFQSESGEYLPAPIWTYPQPIRVVTNDTSNQKLYVKLYKRSFSTPIPPFVLQEREPFKYIPDSTFVIEQRNGRSAFFSPKQTGFYQIQSDTTTNEGFTLVRTYNGFPKVTTHPMMLETLRYLTTAKEYQQLVSNKIPKMAVDSFWIANTGRPDLATELIRKYYSRVETANRLFTSFTDGWKTDRGMIYIVMGKPTKVFRNFDQEVWIYGESDDLRSLKFYFTHVINPFTVNDYILLRQEYYKAIWYQNIQMWRR